MRTPRIITITTASLLEPSVLVVLSGANDEPYTTFRASDAVVQIGVASALMALWAVLAGFIAALVVKKVLHCAWLSVVILCALALCGLYQSPSGYLSDLVRFRVVSE